MTLMVTTTLYLKMIVDCNVDVMMFYDFRDSKITRFG